jgi:biotin synthase-like enzyme
METAEACYGTHPKALAKAGSVSRERVLELLASSLPELLHLAGSVHRQAFDPSEIHATTRILLPATQIRLSAGSSAMSRELQLPCFLAGANAIFLGDQLLTAENPSRQDDAGMLDAFGMKLRVEA